MVLIEIIIVLIEYPNSTSSTISNGTSRNPSCAARAGGARRAPPPY